MGAVAHSPSQWIGGVRTRSSSINFPTLLFYTPSFSIPRSFFSVIEWFCEAAAKISALRRKPNGWTNWTKMNWGDRLI